jgi:hypothetical protein
VLDRLGWQPRAMHDTAQPHARRAAEREAVAHDLHRVAELRLGRRYRVDLQQLHTHTILAVKERE